MKIPAIDNCGRRQGIERRQFSYSVHIPERRTGKDRRRGKVRRVELDLKEKIRKERMRRYHSDS